MLKLHAFLASTLTKTVLSLICRSAYLLSISIMIAVQYLNISFMFSLHWCSA